jgi:hypothetical protein
MQTHSRPQRPLGLTLAILLCVLFFSVLPMMQAIPILWVNYHFNTTVQARLVDNPYDPYFVGMSLPGVNIAPLVVAVLFLVVAVLALRGRPRGIRYILLISVLAVAAINIIGNIQASLAAVDLSKGFDSSTLPRGQIDWQSVGFNIFVTLYTVWYINRAPARAFYDQAVAVTTPPQQSA